MCCENFNDTNAERSGFFKCRPKQYLCLIAKIAGADHTGFAKPEWQTRWQHDERGDIRVTFFLKLDWITKPHTIDAQSGFKPHKARFVD